jgi:hypothetical protein
MKRHILLAVLFGTLLACATLTRAEEEADIDDDEEDEEAEERAFLIVRRAGVESMVIPRSCSRAGCAWHRLLPFWLITSGSSNRSLETRKR